MRSRSTRRGVETFVLVELKARCDDLAGVRARLRTSASVPRRERLSARHEGTVRQIDTYFEAPRGRLKLRAMGGRAQLIYYERPDRAAAKRSDVLIVPIGDGDALRALLDRALGVRTVVSKVREVWRVRDVQVMLDTVAGLGTFVELKKVVRGARALRAAYGELAALRQELGLRAADIEAPSYSELASGRGVTRRPRTPRKPRPASSP